MLLNQVQTRFLLLDVKIFIPEHKRDKLDNPCQRGIFLGNISESTEYVALNFTTKTIVTASSSSSFSPSIFPAIPDEVQEELADYYFNQNGQIKETLFVSTEQKICLPKNVKEALSGPHASEWKAAIDDELQKLKQYQVFSEELSKPEVKVISTRFVFAMKPGAIATKSKFRARLVARGFEEDTSTFSTFSPTPQLDSLRFLLAIYSRNSTIYVLLQFDVKSAFLNSPITRVVYVSPPRDC